MHSSINAMKGLALAAGLSLAAQAAGATSLLFIGNSFTFADRSPVHYWHAEAVDDLNDQGIGGVPALFKSFAVQAGLDYDVHLETEPGVGLDWHLDHRAAMLGQRPWDAVVMQTFSTLDRARPGDPALLVASTRRLAELLRARNPAVEIRLMATWPRADQVYPPSGAWYGKSVDAMARDLKAGVDQAAAATPGLWPVIPVGDAWVRAMRTGVADANPYAGAEPGKIDLWSWDHYHASSYGYYLEALVVFGSITGVDPRSLGDNECSGNELGLAPAQVAALEQVAFDQLSAAGLVKTASPLAARPGERGRCVRLRPFDEKVADGPGQGAVSRGSPVASLKARAR